jgi:pyruvate carboxylase subunit B
VDIIDTALAPFALRTSHPAIEPIVVALQGTPRDTEMDLKQLLKLGQYFESIAPKYRDFLATTRMAVIDTGVLMHQVPGGMISNLIAQLKEANALDRIDEVYAELPRVRKELGFPPLVTPTSQIVGIQAVQNVLFGRYKVISAQVKDYFYGLYGRPPMPVDPEIQKIALQDYERGETPITQRPGDVLDPELDRAIEDTKDIARDIGDVLIYALYPTTGMRFLRWKYGLEEPPPETKSKTIEDIQREDELLAKAKADIMAGKMSAADKAKETPPDEKKTKEPTAIETEFEGTAIKASMPGLIIRFDVKKGDKVKEGDNIVVMEAMKMAIDIVSPVDGTVKSVNFKEGDNVARDDILAIIG